MYSWSKVKISQAFRAFGLDIPIIVKMSLSVANKVLE